MRPDGPSRDAWTIAWVESGSLHVAGGDLGVRLGDVDQLGVLAVAGQEAPGVAVDEPAMPSLKAGEAAPACVPAATAPRNVLRLIG